MADAGALEVHLHPLVLINVSDHVVRFKVANRPTRVLGALLGSQVGRRVDVHNSFELIQDESGAQDIDIEFFKQRLAQYMEVFPTYEFLGWYSTGACPQESDKALHKKIQEISGNENPFLLLLDTNRLVCDRVSQSEDLPVKVYDSTAHVEGANVKVDWNEVPYAIDTLEAERIAVTHVNKTATGAAAGHNSDFTQHTSGLANSVVMLNNRVKELLEHMQEVKAQRVPKNHEVLRQMLSICQALRAIHQDSLQDSFCSEFNDASLVVLLATLTKACASNSDVLDKFHLAHDKKHRHGRHHYPFG